MRRAGVLNWPGKSRMLRTVAPSEAVDRLGVVADHGEAVPCRAHGQQQPGLQAVAS